MTGGKVLVLGDDTRAFLAIVRSLGRQGISVHAAPANFRSPAIHSRYVAETHDLPPWMGDGALWLAKMESLLRVQRFDLVIPCTEVNLLPLQHHRTRLAPLACLAIPDDHSIAVLFDKHETRVLAERVGVPVAVGRLLRPDDTAEAVLKDVGAPVVVKPRHSYRLDSLASRGKAQAVRNPLQLSQLLDESDPAETLLERFFPGQGVGVSLLASHGRVLQAFQHQRVHELAGASFYRISAPLSPDLLRACEAIVAALPYTGIAMFEFKRNVDGDWILLEVNARPWGSMPLPLALGVDFPYRWFRLLTAGEETPAVIYRPGVYGRNLVPDLQASRAEVQARRAEPGARAWFVMRRASELARPLWGREVHDLLVRDDPRPALVELGEVAAAVAQRVGRLLPGMTAWQRRRARARVIAASRNTKKPLVLFVCQGNICRSPFAESLLRSRLDNSLITVGSAGMMPQPGRQTPSFGLQAASPYGIDLSSHRSTWLTRQTAEAASLLIVFDETIRTALFDRYPDLRTPVLLLGHLVGLGDITDPIGGGIDEFRRIYDMVAQSVAKLPLLLCKRNPVDKRESKSDS